MACSLPRLKRPRNNRECGDCLWNGSERVEDVAIGRVSCFTVYSIQGVSSLNGSYHTPFAIFLETEMRNMKSLGPYCHRKRADPGTANVSGQNGDLHRYSPVAARRRRQSNVWDSGLSTCVSQRQAILFLPGVLSSEAARLVLRFSRGRSIISSSAKLLGY